MNGRTRFVVCCLVILFLCSWVVSLGRLIGIHFWDKEYALNYIKNNASDDLFYDSTALSDVNTSYFSVRYVYFLPHVLAAVIWWNLYFFQLVPWIRRRYKSFHRYLGRVLMVTACAQVATGLGLACLSGSSTIKMVSFVLAVSVTYCIYRAWSYAIAKDIRKHKHWVMRLVGHLQTISLQRFWLMILVVSHHMGCHFFYPPLEDASEEEINQVVLQIFDDSFVLSILTSYMLTEWYLDAEQGWMEDPSSEKPLFAVLDTSMSSRKTEDSSVASHDELKQWYGSTAKS